jgi:hypothetical protein
MVPPLLGLRYMDFCIVCKDIAENRYEVKVKDSRLNIAINACLCRHCFNKFIDSHHNKGFFKIARLITWVKEKRDSMRIF